MGSEHWPTVMWSSALWQPWALGMIGSALSSVEPSSPSGHIISSSSWTQCTTADRLGEKNHLVCLSTMRPWISVVNLKLAPGALHLVAEVLLLVTVQLNVDFILPGKVRC